MRAEGIKRYPFDWSRKRDGVANDNVEAGLAGV